MVAAPYAAYQASWKWPLLGMTAGIACALLAAGGLSVLLARRLLWPLGRLAAHARAVALDPERQHGTAADLPLAPVAELEALRQGFAAAAAERHAYAVLAEKEAMLASAQQLTGVGGWSWEVIDPADLEANPVRWTEETYRIFGLEPGSVAVSVTSFLAAIPPADRPRVRATLERALRDRRPYRLEHRILRPDGTVRLVEELASLELDGQGRVRRMVGSCQDVTERRMAEAAVADNAERLRELLSTLDLAAFMARDPDGTIRFWSAGCERLFGWSAAEALGRNAHDLLGTVFPVPLAEIEAALARDGSWMGELRHRRRNGEEVVVVAHKALRRDAAGRPVAVVESVADVTALHATQEALVESEARLRLALEGAGLGLWEQDFARNRFRLDAQAAAMTGGLLPGGAWLSGDGPEIAAWEAAVHPEDRARREASRAATIADGEGLMGVEFRVRIDGAWRWLASRSTVLGRDPGTRRASRVLSVVRDVTEATEAAEALRESEARLRSVFDSALDGIVVATQEGVIVSANRAAARMFGHPGPEALVGQDLGVLMPSAKGARHAARLARMATAPEARAMAPGRTLRACRADGSEFPIEASVGGFEVAGRSFVTGILRDISDRVAAERALAESEAEFRATFEQAAVGIAHVALDGGWLRVNDRFCAITGYPREQLLGLNFRQITHPESLAEDVAQMQALLAGDIDTYAMEKRYIQPDGRPVWVNLTVSLLRDAAGRPERFISVIEDIAARKAAEAALAESELRYRTLFERMEEGFALWEAIRDADGKIVDFRLLERNEAVDRVTGRMPQACIGRSMRTLFPDVAPDWFAAYVRAAETGEPQAMEDEAPTIGRWLSARMFRPAPERVAVLVRDVTERVLAEAAIRDSEAMLRRVLDNLFSFVAVLAPDGTLLDANRAPLESAGITLEEVRGRPFWEAHWWSYDPAVQARLHEACARAAEGEASRFDVEVRMAAESRITVDFQIAPLRDEAGRIIHLIPSAVDITERKRSEEAKMLLAREVDHRAKNALAVVQSVLTLTRTEDPAAFKKAVMGRIAAMALAHTLLARERWNGADLRVLLTEELAAYRGGGGLEAAVQLDGPLVGLAPDAAQPVAMAIHELATNAAKYGALSVPGGRVTISWARDPRTGGLTLVWRERGGPPVSAPPERRGFGTSLIQTTVVRQLQGSLEMLWEPAGLRCVLELPAQQVLWRSHLAPRPGRTAGD